MPRSGMTPRHLKTPRINYIYEEVGYDQFTDGGSTVGTYQMVRSIPVGAYCLGSRVVTLVAFIGDTSAALTIGDGSDVDRYNTSTMDVFAAASANGVECGLVSGTKTNCTSAPIRPTLTITSGSDWGAVTAGRVYVEIAFVEFTR